MKSPASLCSCATHARGTRFDAVSGTPSELLGGFGDKLLRVQRICCSSIHWAMHLACAFCSKPVYALLAATPFRSKRAERCVTRPHGTTAWHNVMKFLRIELANLLGTSSGRSCRGRVFQDYNFVPQVLRDKSGPSGRRPLCESLQNLCTLLKA